MSASTAEGRLLSASALALSAVALGWALQVNLGTYHPDALPAFYLAYAAALVGLGLAGTPWGARAGWLLLCLLGAAAMVEVAHLVTKAPGVFLRLRGPPDLVPFYGAAVAMAALAGSGLTQDGFPGATLRPPLLLLAFFVLGAWVIRHAPFARIDVFVFQKEAALALRAGQNPFAMTFPDILRDPLIYGPGLQQNGRLMFGFPYPPLALLLTAPVEWLWGDFRFAQLGCLLVAAGAMAYAVPGNRVGFLAAAGFLLTPRGPFVLEQGWSDPLILGCLGLVVLCAARAPRFTPYALGAFFACKQYSVLALPAAFLLLPRPWSWRETGRFVLKAFAVGAAVTLPFVLWDVAAFWKSVVALQFIQPFRPDSLSFLAIWKNAGHPEPSTAWVLVALAGVVPLALWRCPRSPFGFAVATAVTAFTFFAFNKQAFCNYYHFVVGALWLAVACSPLPSARAPVSDSA